MSDNKRQKGGVKGSLNQLAELVGASGMRLRSDTSRHPKVRSDSPTGVSQSSSANKTDHTDQASQTNQANQTNQTDDDQLFSEAMQGVARSSWRPGPVACTPRTTQAAAVDPDLEARRLMQEALETATPIQIPDHPEYIEGWVGGAGKRFLPKLRDGVYSIQGQIDLHGLSRLEAEEAVEDYLRRMSRFHSCCVKIIHGRGINSPADKATLKDALQRLLSTRRMSRYVVAYASAPSRDGGVGAVYVLLSRQ